ncbi:MAG: hypothetical protein PHY47_20150 [Lachnospiraceae bacterium]|nr:hypothetical protein [Lachnospiraceae bacterium]
MKDKTKEEKVDKLHKNGNSILNSAKYSSNNTDEWYTTYETIADTELMMLQLAKRCLTLDIALV